MTNFYSKPSLMVSLIFLTFSLFSQITVTAQSPILSLSPVISSGLNQPIQLVNAKDGSNRVFIVQKEGIIKVYNQSYTYLSDFLTVSGITSSGERGLLSMAFHPDYNNNGFFFVYYTNGNGDLEIARYHVSANANIADAASKVVVITIPHPTNDNHNGGELHFGTDGYLYLSTGDGGGGGDVPNNAQNTAVQLGKILRLSVNTSANAPFYSYAPGNPYPNGIYALGLRNPFRWSFDSQTQDMWIGDVGQGLWEEIDHRAAGSTAGANYGWRCYEGNADYNTTGCADKSNYVFPVLAYPNPTNPNTSTAITGGCVYHGSDQDLQGYYVAADFYSGNFYKIAPNGNAWDTSTQFNLKAGIADFGETENGELYAVSLTENAIFRILAAPGGPLPVRLVDLSAKNMNGAIELTWKTSFEQDLKYFAIEFSTNGNDFRQVSLVTPQNNARGASYTFSHVTGYRDRLYYRLKMIGKDDNYQYSNTISFDPLKAGRNLIYPSVVKANGKLNLVLSDQFDYIEMVTLDGKMLLKQKITGRNGNVEVQIPGLSAAGVYLVRLKGEEKTVTQKIVVQ